MKGGAHILADRSVVGFHSLADPVEHDADKTVLIEISDKIFLRLSDGCPDGLFLDNTHDQIVGQAEEEVFNLFTVQGTVGIHNESFVFVHSFHYGRALSRRRHCCSLWWKGVNDGYFG